MIVCPLCCKEYIFTTYLCDSCNKIKYYHRIYGTMVIDVLDEVFVIKKAGIEKKTIKLKGEILSAVDNKIKNK